MRHVWTLWNMSVTRTTMYKNILGNYTISISPAQATFILELMSSVDIYVMSTGEYLEFALLKNKLEEIVQDNKLS